MAKRRDLPEEDLPIHYLSAPDSHAPCLSSAGYRCTTIILEKKHGGLVKSILEARVTYPRIREQWLCVLHTYDGYC